MADPKGRKLPLTPSLGPGESEAILLAMAHESSLLIMDDRLARRYVLRRGLSLIGSARVLLLAEEQGMIESAQDAVEAMAANGYRISPALLDVIRRKGGEECTP